MTFTSDLRDRIRKIHANFPYTGTLGEQSFNIKMQNMKNNIPLTPANIGENINYSTGSIVSKIIFKSDKLQITLFAVAEGESFEEHTTSKKAIVHILEGKGEFYLKDKWCPFKKGDYFYMPAGLIHAIAAKTEFKFLLYLF